MNLAAIVDAHNAESVAVIYGGSRITYGQFRDDVAAARGALRASGVGRADRVAICTSDSYQLLIGAFASWADGALAVPLNAHAPDAELRREIDAVSARYLWGDARDVGAKSIRREGAPVTEPPSDLPASEPALALFTSGTAGAPRAALLSHGNVLSNLRQVRQHAGGAAAMGAGDAVLCAIPLFHIFGLSAVAGAALNAGARLVLFDRFEPAAVIDAVAAHSVTVLPAVPAMWHALLHAPGAGTALRAIRLAGSGAAHLPVDLAREARDQFGLDIKEGYGLTETAPIVAMAAGTAAPLGSVGRPLPGVELRLVDQSGNDVLIGDEGEVWVRGPNVFSGYLDDPEATSQVFTRGWLRTGDIATVDSNGFLYIVDRIKHLIIVSGFNVFPAEVEDAIARHPAVREVAVVGEPDTRTGEAVHAYVVATGPLTEAEVRDHAAAALARYKCPTRVSFVASLPHGATGKVRRSDLPRL